MDECCMEFCKQLDAWLLDELEATKDYRQWADKASKNNQPLVSALLRTLAIDENKHAEVITELKVAVCKH